jgi:hypothetical protein
VFSYLYFFDSIRSTLSSNRLGSDRRMLLLCKGYITARSSYRLEADSEAPLHKAGFAS